MSSDNEISQQIDQTYKNLLDKFNPTARQIITAGKAYLKALHGASAASKVYLGAISRLSSQVEESPTGTSSNIGTGLDQVVEVYKEIQSYQSNILKAFYVDFIVPLESNLEKDAKSLQVDHKRFVTRHKSCEEALSKAELNVRKQRKKKSSSKNSIDKEIKTYQTLDEERLNFETFLDRSLKEVKLQERRRYSFVLECLSSLGHHHLALYSKGSSLLQKHVDSWTSISNRVQNNDSFHRNDNEVIYSTPEENLVPLSSVTSNKKRSQSLDGHLSDGERRSPPPFNQIIPQQDYPTSRTLSKSKSDYNLEQCHKDDQNANHHSRRSSLTVPERKDLARATFPFHANAENQLNFEEGDVITLIGEKKKGWQYGENERTHEIGWFPVAYTECLEDEDSAIGRCSSNNDPPSLQSKVSHETSKRDDSSYLPLRGQSLDRLENRKKNEKKIRARSSSNTPKRRERSLSVHSPSPSLRQILIEEEKGRTYYTIQSPSSSCTSDNKKSFETFNSHLFLSDDMEEDLESYEGNYQGHPLYHRCKEDKYTSFSADRPQNHLLSPHPLASNEIPPCFRKSVSSRDSTHCSDDSGYSKEDNNAKRSSCSYSDCSRSCNSSWVTDSYEMCSDRNTANEDSYNPYSTDGRGSPTFLKYLYPTYKDYPNTSKSIKHSSLDELDKVSSVESRKENWISTAFGTLGKKKKNLVSPCAQKIASQKARKKNEKNNIHRSSSLLCIDMTCTSSPDENCASDYEDITYATWHHKAKIDVPNILPSPPPYDPPPLPTSTSSNYIQYSEQPENSQNKAINSVSNKPSESSSGNSSWSENEGSSKEDYMIIKEKNINNVILKTENNQFNRRTFLTRSYTWASPDFKKHSKGKKKDNENYLNKSKPKLFKNGFSNPFSTNPKPERKRDINNLNSVQNYQSLPLDNDKEDVAPPLPPRKRPQIPSTNNRKEINIFNYSEYMCQRLTNPEGTCRFDQRSFTTGQKCSAWYDLWGRDMTVGNLV